MAKTNTDKDPIADTNSDTNTRTNAANVSYTDNSAEAYAEKRRLRSAATVAQIAAMLHRPHSEPHQSVATAIALLEEADRALALRKVDDIF